MLRIVRNRALAAIALAGLLAAAAPAHASDATVGPDSRVGVVMAAICGLSARLTPIAPVPYAGIAVVSCAVALIDAWNQPD